MGNPLTTNATGSMTTSLSSLDDNSGTLAIKQQITKNQSGVATPTQMATPSPLKEAVEDAHDGLDIAMAKMAFGNVEKKPAPRPVRERIKAGNRADGFESKANDYEKATRGDIKATTLRMVRAAFKEGKPDQAMKMLQETYKEPEQANLIDETLSILEQEETDTAIRRTITEQRDAFSDEHKQDIDKGRRMSAVAREIAAAGGSLASEGYKFLIHAADENISAPDLGSELLGKFATLDETRKYLKTALSTLGGVVRDSNIDRVQLLFFNRAGRKAVTVYSTAGAVEALLKRVEKEASQLEGIDESQAMIARHMPTPQQHL
jgi:hypothetical protein